jgi:SAM-dependent methyltransferase
MGTLLYLLLLILLLGAMLSIVVYALRVGITPMPTSPRVRALMLSLLPRDERGTVLELGSGWGTLAFALADHCPQARVVGIELSPLPYAFARLRQRLAPRANLRFVRDDFFHASFSEASVIVCYVHRDAMRRLSLRLKEELPPGARVLSNTFALRGWTPSRTLVARDLYRSRVYLYEIPARAEGGPAGGI